MRARTELEASGVTVDHSVHVAPHEIGTEYTCTTLVVAGLHYSGFRLDSTWRGGLLDIVTPRQVVESWGESP